MLRPFIQPLPTTALNVSAGCGLGRAAAVDRFVLPLFVPRNFGLRTAVAVSDSGTATDRLRHLKETSVSSGLFASGAGTTSNAVSVGGTVSKSPDLPPIEEP